MKKFKLPDMSNKYSITKTIGIKYPLIEKLEQISKENNISLNRVMIECIEFALKILEFKEKK